MNSVRGDIIHGGTLFTPTPDVSFESHDCCYFCTRSWMTCLNWNRRGSRFCQKKSSLASGLHLIKPGVYQTGRNLAKSRKVVVVVVHFYWTLFRLWGGCLLERVLKHNIVHHMFCTQHTCRLCVANWSSLIQCMSVSDGTWSVLFWWLAQVSHTHIACKRLAFHTKLMLAHITPFYSRIM